jgi:hypothetical protein
MKLVTSVCRAILGRSFVLSAVVAAVVAGSASRASAQTTNLGPNGGVNISVPEINSSGVAGLAIVLLGTVALIAESKAKPARKS